MTSLLYSKWRLWTIISVDFHFSQTIVLFYGFNLMSAAPHLNFLTDSPWDPQAWKEMGGPMTPTFLGGLGVYHDPFQWPRVKKSIFGLNGLRNGLAIFYKVNLRLLKMTLLRSPWPQCHSTFWDLWKCGKKDSNNFWPPYTVEAGAASIEKKDPKLGRKKNGFDSITETSEGDFVTKNT